MQSALWKTGALAVVLLISLSLTLHMTALEHHHPAGFGGDAMFAATHVDQKRLAALAATVFAIVFLLFAALARMPLLFVAHIPGTLHPCFDCAKFRNDIRRALARGRLNRKICE